MQSLIQMVKAVVGLGALLRAGLLLLEIDDHDPLIQNEHKRRRKEHELLAHIALVREGHDAHGRGKHTGHQALARLGREEGKARDAREGVQRDDDRRDLEHVVPHDAVERVLPIAHDQPDGVEHDGDGAIQADEAEMLDLLIVGLAQIEGEAEPREKAEGRQHAQKLRVLIRLARGDEQHRAKAHQAARRPAQDRKKAAGVEERLTKLLRNIEPLLLDLLRKFVENDRRGDDDAGDQKVEDAPLRKAGLIKGHHDLKPAHEHAEGPGAADITCNFQGSFLHNHVPVSI